MTTFPTKPQYGDIGETSTIAGDRKELSKVPDAFTNLQELESPTETNFSENFKGFNIDFGLQITQVLQVSTFIITFVARCT